MKAQIEVRKEIIWEMEAQIEARKQFIWLTMVASEILLMILLFFLTLMAIDSLASKWKKKHKQPEKTTPADMKKTELLEIVVFFSVGIAYILLGIVIAKLYWGMVMSSPALNMWP